MVMKRILPIIFLCILVFTFHSSCNNVSAVRPAEIIVNKVKILPEAAAPFETINITAEIGNIGGTAENYTAILKIDGKETERKIVSVASSENLSIDFTVVAPSVGQHEVMIGPAVGKFSVYDTKRYILQRGKNNCDYWWYLINPNGQWVRFIPPTTPFQIYKIYIFGKRTDSNAAESKHYTVKIWDGDFKKELYSVDYPYTNFNANFNMVEHSIQPPLTVTGNFTVEFISHGEQVSSNNFSTIGVCLDFAENNVNYSGVSSFSDNSPETMSIIINNEPSMARSYWSITVDGIGQRIDVAEEVNYEINDNVTSSPGRISFPNEYVEWKISDYYYYIGADTPNCGLICNITNKHTKWKMVDVTLRGVLLAEFILPNSQISLIKAIPCRQEGRLKAGELSWKWQEMGN